MKVQVNLIPKQSGLQAYESNTYTHCNLSKNRLNITIVWEKRKVSTNNLLQKLYQLTDCYAALVTTSKSGCLHTV
jgi:hypothetical protein